MRGATAQVRMQWCWLMYMPCWNALTAAAAVAMHYFTVQCWDRWADVCLQKGTSPVCSGNSKDVSLVLAHATAAVLPAVSCWV